jgi:hypothetical protein
MPFSVHSLSVDIEHMVGLSPLHFAFGIIFYMALTMAIIAIIHFTIGLGVWVPQEQSWANYVFE